MNIAVVTTFSAKGYEEYGKAFLASYLKHWSVPLHVYWEGPQYPRDDVRQTVKIGKQEIQRDDPRVIWHDLDLDKDRAAFLARHPGKEKDYRTAAKRFCHKIFALTDPERLKLDVDTWIWLDADVVTTSDIDADFLLRLCPDGFVGSYLGRKDWPHSECGFVSYRGDAGRAFLRQFRGWYCSDKIFEFAETHDSFIFDQLRKELGGWWYDISVGKGGMHVWDDCVLGTRMKHKKGPLRKAGASAGLPAGYGSIKEAKALAKQTVAKVGGQSLLVKTKNCVPNEKIQANVHYSSTLAPQWIRQCDMDMDSTIVFCSGGPSLKNHLDEIRKLSKKKDHYIVCVKTSHDTLIENKIIPWGCVLLDPRAHVQDFIENPHPKVIYFTASMCHPTTWDRLLDKNAQVFGYHALVGAGEEGVLKSRFTEGAMMLGGGCSAAMRGVSVLHAVGFRRFKLFAYDCSFDTEPDWTQKNGSGDAKFLEVEVLGRKFWTDAEKIAQCQDFVKMLEQNKEISLEVFGDGMVAHIFHQKRELLPKFKDLLYAVQSDQVKAA